MLFNYKQDFIFSEDDVQALLTDYLREYKFKNFNKWESAATGYAKYDHKVVREFHVPECNRISDVILYKTDRIIYNFECKLTDIQGVLKQAEDHLLWADYSYIVMPQGVYIPTMYYSMMIKKGIGFIIYIHGSGFYEIIKGLKNTKKDKQVRSQVLKRLKNKFRENDQLRLI